MLRLFARCDEAMRQVRASVALREQLFGKDHELTLQARLELVKVQMERGDWRGARDDLEPLAETCARVFGPGDERTVRCRQLIARTARLLGRYAESMQLAEQLRPIAVGNASLPIDLVMAIRLEYADCRLAKGDVSGAIEEVTACLAESRERLGDSDPTTVHAANSLGFLHLLTDRIDDAEPLLREVHAWRLARFGPRHPSTLQSVHNLAGIVEAQGDTEGAVALLRQAYEGRAATIGPRRPETLGSLLSLANTTVKTGRLDAARALFAELLQVIGEGIDDTPWLLPYARGCDAVVVARMGNVATALPVLAQSVAELQRIEGNSSQRVRELRRALSRLQSQGEGSDGERR